ncbi:NAD-dependent epimerase/dehydratase family protein [Ruminococcus sp. Marseille-P6503]|uniref:NAD-dependent epimerase/dehydratase family protein n=1 Tax=Ruminococcus sp. Marseille-P6503 TaxID=2364796 RepID=UPI000F53CB3F|nr:NAD-dependent epimerase/dehydratase family protein [Ruminococcus sp. Marseille-P6503]
MKKIFIVTGANGFLGNNIVRKLEGYGEVRALVLPDDKIDSLKGVNCSIYHGDVTRPESLNEIFEAEADSELTVIHCAAIVYIKTRYDPRVREVNVNGVKNIVGKALEKNAKLVYVSSVHAITEKPGNEVITETSDFDPGKVVGEYAKTKAEAAEYVLKMVRERDLNACILHPSGIIGPYDFGRSHLTQLILDCADGSLKACVNGGYDFVDVRDVAEGVINACTYGEKGECYILSNRYITVKELLDLVSEARKTKKIKTVLPLWFAKLTAPLSEIYYKLLKEPPLYTKYSLYTLTSNANFSSEKAREKLNYKTRSMKETITDTVKWLEARGEI